MISIAGKASIEVTYLEASLTLRNRIGEAFKSLAAACMDESGDSQHPINYQGFAAPCLSLFSPLRLSVNAANDPSNYFAWLCPGLLQKTRRSTSIDKTCLKFTANELQGHKSKITLLSSKYSVINEVQYNSQF